MSLNENEFEKKIKLAVQLVKQGNSYLKAQKMIGIDRHTIKRYCEAQGIASPLAAKLKSKPVEIKPSFWQKVKRLFG